MTAATLPHVAALYCGDGRPWYPARPTIETQPDENDVLWFAEPVIPAGCPMRWADTAEIASPHVVLNLTTVAELLFAAPADVGDDTDDDELAQLVLAELDRWHCDLAGPMALLAQEAGDHPESARRRMGLCLRCAARLLGTGASS